MINSIFSTLYKYPLIWFLFTSFLGSWWVNIDTFRKVKIQSETIIGVCMKLETEEEKTAMRNTCNKAYQDFENTSPIIDAFVKIFKDVISLSIYIFKWVIETILSSWLIKISVGLIILVTIFTWTRKCSKFWKDKKKRDRDLKIQEDLELERIRRNEVQFTITPKYPTPQNYLDKLSWNQNTKNE